MSWLVWIALVLAIVVSIVNAWIALRRSRASGGVNVWRRERTTGGGLASLEGVDEQGYLYSRKIGTGCVAAVAQTPFGARIVAGKYGPEGELEPQYAWDFTSVRRAENALRSTAFVTDPMAGVLVNNLYPERQPQGYFRRWRYSEKGQIWPF